MQPKDPPDAAQWRPETPAGPFCASREHPQGRPRLRESARRVRIVAAALPLPKTHPDHDDVI